MKSNAHNKLMLIFSICMFTLLSCTSVNETWGLVKLLSNDIKTDKVEEVVEVRNCGIPEQTTTSCNAGTTADLSLTIGGSFGPNSISIDPSISSTLGIGRDSGESIDLPLPQNGFIYKITVQKIYKVVTGQVLARSSTGEEEVQPYTFQANCSINIMKREVYACTPTTKSVTVPGNTLWYNTGIQIVEGQSFIISASGNINTQSDYEGSDSGPDGQITNCPSIDPPNKFDCLINGEPYGKLVGKIGNGEAFPIGSYLEVNSNSNGILYFAVNDNSTYFDDNSGYFKVNIQFK